MYRACQQTTPSVEKVHHSHHHNSAPKVEAKPWNVAATVALVKKFEGLRLTAYRDSVGVLTIGYGHTGSDVSAGMTITNAKAEEFLTKDLQVAINCVSNALTALLNQNQVGALGSFTFNLGCGAFRGSTLLKRLNALENANLVASQEMPKWVNAGGKKLPGLVARRNAEVVLFKQ